MKNLRFTLIGCFIILQFSLHAQWNTSSTSDNYTFGNVGIGLTTPSEPLHIFQRNLSVGQVHNLLNIQANADAPSHETGFGSRILFTFQKYGNVASGINNALGAITVYEGSNHSSHGIMAFATKEDYNSSLANKMWLDRFGRLGIGTSTPMEPLHIFRRNLTTGKVHDMINIQANADASSHETGFGSRILFTFQKYGNIANGDEFALGAITVYEGSNHSSHGTMAFATKEDYNATLSNKMWLDRFGRLGIGTDQPDAKLAVNGKIHAEEVKISVAVPAPDYVFEEDYPLASLDEIKAYITENNHLPEVPSAKEMETNGIELGEMNMLLLKKIEELTLLLIEEKEENEKNTSLLNSRILKLEQALTK